MNLVVVGLAICAGLFGPLFPAQARLAVRARFAHLPPVLQGVAFALVVLLIDALGPRGIAPFIYFRF